MAGDRFLPRQLTKRGHRLTFSNGIIVLAVVAIGLLLVTRSNVTALVAVYAIGVFTGFTLAGAGMSKHHWSHRGPGWKHKLLINGSASVLSLVVVMVLVIAKFAQGAWTVVVLFPLLTMALIRLNRQYRAETELLERGAIAASEMPVLRRHVVLVFVDRLDMATARAIQYARSLNPDEIRAVHFVLDNQAAQVLREQLGTPHDQAPPAGDKRMPRPRASGGRHWNWSARLWRTARRKSPCCCPAASTPGDGGTFFTTAPPTAWPPWSGAYRTPTPPWCRSSWANPA